MFSEYLNNYNFSFVFLLGAFIFSCIFAILPFFLSKVVNDFEKFTVFECGVEPFGGFSRHQNVQFFLIAVFFLIFDIEVVFLFPWAVTAHSFESLVGVVFFIPFYFFMFFLLLGYVFEYLSGGIDWTYGGAVE